MDREAKNEKEENDREREKGVAAMVACYQGFDPAAYLQYNYMPPRADFDRQDSIVPWKLGCLHRAFTEGDVGGDVLVDVGSGPTLYQVLSGCEVFDTVFLTDFLEVNRQELRRWLQGEGYSSLDWTPYLQHVCKLEGRRPSAWTEKAARLRSVVSDILPIDVHLPRPLHPDSQLPTAGADCLVSCFCLESVSPDLASFTRALGHIRGLLRPGGHLLLIGALGESYYMGGPGVRIPVVPLDEAQVCASVRASGYTLVRLEVYTLPQGMMVGVDDVTGVFFVKARKP
ncbi:phenylethanolamine N-methyltransferase [Oncorhynchus nerka]|uniref:Phenylethanolamine N-methyltransferase n=2 Tax=Salmoninae TaxID=504568 RepID=A0A8C7FS40_ONCKI|nr:phenylethanolamine N-methyltransferase [Salmo salar]XP_020309969.1 phenylethanolamine N-methyltransferase [Oncorhynchus kisutch]|eukprot:XP_014014686.1 PREDICTED: phenylethanolamine N-methyltransferase [Salmo salar]